MKQIAFVFAGLFFFFNAHATDGKTTECFNLGTPYYKDFPANGQAYYLKTEGTLCVVEKNMVDAGDEMTSTGDITITLRNGKGVKVAVYKLGAKFSEGAAGTAYTTYAHDVATLSTQDTWDKITFAMRNDHIEKGQYAGRVTLNGAELTLLQR
jgi:hypothetical protein